MNKKEEIVCSEQDKLLLHFYQNLGENMLFVYVNLLICSCSILEGTFIKNTKQIASKFHFKIGQTKEIRDTWTTLTTKNKETGREKITNNKEPRAIALANIPGPSSHAK